jgi:cbb3-type cytochrome oxidase maturation protein
VNLWTTGLLVVLSLVIGVAAWLLFLWSVRSGQMDDVEAPKHRMLDDEEEEPPREGPP